MRPSLARGQLHELVPVIRDLLTAAPVLLQVVKHSLPLVIAAGRVAVLLRQERPLGASLVRTHEFTFLRQLKRLKDCDILTTGTFSD